MNNLICANFLDWLTDNRAAFAPGPGLWCTLHIVLMVLFAAWTIAFIFIAFKYPKFAKKLGAVLAIAMVVMRILRMILMVASGRFTFVQALPWHLCHIMCFALCIIYFIKPTKFSLPILFLSVLGGTMTFIFGDYYYSATLTFFMYESIFLHFCLQTVVICYIASRKPKYNIWDIVSVGVVLAILCGWASLGNYLCPGQNYMFLQSNGLPFNLFPGHSFWWTYVVMAVIIVGLVALAYVAAVLIKRKKAKKARSNG